MADRTVSRRSVLKQGAALLGASPITASTDSGESDRRTVRTGPGSAIQDAVDDASDGDTVVITGGTYHERVTIDKSITLRGAGDVAIQPPRSTLRESGLNPVISVSGTGTQVTVEEISITGNTVRSTVFGTGIAYLGASGRVTNVSVSGLDTGVLSTRHRGHNGTSTVAVRGSRFEDLSTQPLIFNEVGTVGHVRDNVIIGTPGRTQYGVTAGFGAQIDARGNQFNRLVTDNGFGIGVLTYNSPDSMVMNNRFDNVQYPVYVTSDDRVNLDRTELWSSFVRNAIDSPEIKDRTESYGAVICGHGEKNSDEPVLTNRVEVSGNEFANLDVGISTFTVGEGVSQEIRQANNRFTNVTTVTGGRTELLSVEPLRVPSSGPGRRELDYRTTGRS